MRKTDKYYTKKIGRKRYVPNLRGIGEGQLAFFTIQEAVQYYDQSMADHQNGDFIKSSTNPKFEGAAGFFVASLHDRAGVTLETIRTHERNINFLLSHVHGLRSVRVVDLTTAFIEEKIFPAIFLQSHSTGLNRFNTLRAILKYAVKRQWLRHNPARETDLPKQVVKNKEVARITKADIALIIDHAGSHALHIKFAARTGLRAGEQVALCWDDVDLADQVLSVNFARKTGGRIGETKTAAGRRSIPLDADLAADLRLWKISQPIGQRNKNLVFPNAAGNHADSNNWRNRGLIPACVSAGLAPIRWHDLRHHFASVLLFNTTLTDAQITQFIGHKSIDFTRKQYAKWLSDPRRDKNLAEELSVAFR
jgi:integrase